MGESIREKWKQFGELPALPVAVAVFAIGDGAALVARPVAGWVALIVIPFYILYCIARPRGGWGVFWPVLIPGPAARTAHDVFGIADIIVSIALLPVMFWLIWDNDRESELAGVLSDNGR